MFNNKYGLLMGVLAIVLLAFITGCTSSTDEKVELKPAVKQPVSFNELQIEKSDITEIAKFYPVVVDDVEMEVIAALATDGTIRTAFNACQVCASSGRGYYIQEGHKLVCQNCGNKFDIDELEITRNGCNPAPIDSTDKVVDEKYINIPKETFIENMDLFRF